LAPFDDANVNTGLSLFHDSARILDQALEHRDWLLGDALSYADFRMATFLPFNDVAGLPVQDYKSVARWLGQLTDIKEWQDPFDGLVAPPLPSVNPAKR
jgi:glutathione S-transferase